MTTTPNLKDQIQDILPLSPLQRGVLFHTLFAPSSPVYFEQLICRIDGNLDPSIMSEALERLAQRHPILRTAFVIKGQSEPRQVVFRQARTPLNVLDWSENNTTERTRRLEVLLDEDRRRGFQLNRPPLMRLTLLRYGPQEWRLIWSHHHILLDGWSLPILMRDYFALLSGTTLPSAPPPFSTYLGWLARQDKNAATSHWRAILGDFSSPTPLGLDRPARPGDLAGDNVAQIECRLDYLVDGDITTAAEHCHVTLGTLLLGAWAILLSRYSRQNDVVFGITLSGRAIDLPGVNDMVGLLINSLPLRVTVPSDTTLPQWLNEVQRRQLKLQTLSYSDLAEVQRHTGVPRGQALFETLVAIDNFPIGDALPSAVLDFKISEVSQRECTHYPLTLTVVPGTDGLILKIGFDRARIDDLPASALAEAYLELLRQIAARPDAALCQLSLVRPTAPQPPTPLSRPKKTEPNTLSSAFLLTAERFPDRLAISDGPKTLTYRQLRTQAVDIAERLKQDGVAPGVRVGICLPRSADQISAMLGVILAGGVYLPLDPDYPAERLAYQLTDSQALLTLTDPVFRSRLPEEHYCLSLAEINQGNKTTARHPIDLKCEHGAYVIYTSGSTGQPKGVLVSHHNVLRLFSASARHFSFGENDVWTYFHSFAFDFSVWEIWGALLHGGRCVVVPRELGRDPSAFVELLANESVTVLNQTPSAFKLLMTTQRNAALPRPSALRWIIFGGDALRLKDLRPWLDLHGDSSPRLANMYGITETTVHVTFRRIFSADLDANLELSPIGEPLDDLSMELIDPCGHTVPVGAPGEILIGGEGLSLGYLNRPQLNTERFPGYGAQRRYRSGDLARRNTNGELFYFGRIDQQVKVRGFRIELGEVRAALLSHPAVRDVHLASKDDQLIAYLRTEIPESASTESLRRHLARQLPAHMIPATFISLPEFPLTLNGKIDEKALFSSQSMRSVVDTPHIEATTPRQKLLAEIWSQVLSIPNVGIRDNYFSLGGDSIRSVRIAALAQERGCPLSIQDIFRHATIETIVEAIGEDSCADAPNNELQPFALIDANDRSLLPSDVEDALPLTRLQAGMLFHNEYDDGRNLYHDVFSHRLRGDINSDDLRQALTDLICEHPILRTSFALAGYSQPLQLVWRNAKPPLEMDDLRGLSTQQIENTVAQQISNLREQRFKPEQAPLLRIGFLQLADDEWQLTLAIHHAILDGWSVATLCTRLFARMRGRISEPARSNSFRNFVAAEGAALIDPAQQAYWRAQLIGQPSATIPRWPQRITPTGKDRVGTHTVSFQDTLTATLFSQAAAYGLPLKTILLAVHARVLACLCGQDEIVTGLVSNGRPADSHASEALGLFLNTLPLRVRVSGSWRDFLTETLRIEGASLPYRFFPMAEVFKLGEAARFETSFNYVDFYIYQQLNASDGMKVLDTISIESVDIPLAVTFSVRKSESSITLAFSYDRAAFPDEQVVAISRLYQTAATALIHDPDALCLDSALADIPEYVAESMNGSLSELFSFSVPQAVADCAQSHPNSLAISGYEESLSYVELNERANRLAHQLVRLGAGPDVVVALDLPRSPDLVVAMLATLKASAAYLTLDRGQPEARRIEILLEASPMLLISRDHSAYAPPGCTVILMNHSADLDKEESYAPIEQVHGDALAYLLFTSGSSGRPKGVGISRTALDNHMAWMNRRYPLDASDAVLQKTPVGFDASIWEFWAPLTQGARLILAADEGHRDPDYLIRTIREQSITVLQLVPSLLSILLSTPDFSGCDSLRRVFVGGEALSASTLKRFHATLGIPLVNLYGPTETTIDASSKEYQSANTWMPAVSIGSPIDGIAFRVLDGRLNPVPPGVRGELYIAGCGLARCYMGQPAQTARRFLPDPLSPIPGGRMYRSGDFVRLLPEGVLEYLGRSDSQVKLRGQRFELEEIEARLATCPGVVQSAASLYRDNSGIDRLAGYVGLTPEAEAGDWRTAILSALRLRLPDYMLPTQLILLHQWPVNSNGKVDRAALLPPQAETSAPTRSRAPSTLQEQALAEIWRKVLGADSIGVDDNFFQLGGDSILGLQMVAQARQAGMALAARDIFSHPTVAELAAKVRPTRQEVELMEIPAGKVLPLTPTQRWFFERISTLPRPAHWNQALLLSVAESIHSSVLRRSLLRLEQHHDVFRLRFTSDADGWHQHYAPFEAMREEDWLERVDLSGLPTTEHAAAIEARSERAQRELNLESGPLLRVIHFDFGNGKISRILFIIHHLIVDGVSWRVLLEELAGLLTGVEAAPVRVGFGHWALNIPTPPPEERDYWLKQSRLADDAARIPIDIDAEQNNLYGATETVTLSLNGSETSALLQGGILRASAEEMLLSAALGTLRDWLDTDVLLVTIEGHGRDNETLDISRTVGWFTALYPLTVSGLAGASPQRLLRTVKQALRAVPAGGSSYGALRYSDDTAAQILASAPEPQIAFNYLGQFDSSLPSNGMLTPSTENIGQTEDPDGRRPHLIDIVALISDGKLSLRFNYAQGTLQHTTVETLARGMQQRLIALLSLGANVAAEALTSSDFPLATLDDDNLPAAVLGERGDIVDLWSLTPVQEGMLFHSRMEVGDASSGIYIEQIVAELDGEVDPTILHKAWEKILERHDALRVSFVWEGLLVPLQRVHQTPELPFSICEAPDEAALESYLAADRASGFELGTPPLMRLTLITRNNTPWRLVWTHHHALLDGWSMAIIFDEALTLYRELSRGRSTSFSPPLSFGRFIKWLRENNDRKTQETFWRDYFNGYTATLDLALLPEGNSPKPRAHSLRLNTELSSSLRWTARERKVTLNTLFLGALAVAISRVGRCDDIMIGVTMAGRPESLFGSDSAVGLFINTLPLRADCSANQPIGDFLYRLQNTQSCLVTHESNALVDIHRWSGLPPRQTLFDVVLVYENYPIRTEVGTTAQALRIGSASAREQSNYPLTIYVKPGTDGIDLDGVFDAARIEPERVAAILGALPLLLRQIESDAKYVGNLRLAEPVAPDTYPPLEHGDNVLTMLTKAARETPNKIAVSAEDGNLSYQQLVSGARVLARHFISEGISQGDTIAIALPPDSRALTALLATLWAGAQYLPMDPMLPPIRREAIIADACPKIIFVEGKHINWPDSDKLKTLPTQIHTADDDHSTLPGDTLHPEAPAYILFTSGSTGRPKGVQIAHRSLANILRHFSAEPGFYEDDILLSVTNWSFDISVLELLLPLVCGGCVTIMPGSESGDGLALATKAARCGANVIQATPASWRILLESGWRPSPGFRAWSGGEALPTDLSLELLEAGATLWNVYGPTETTIWSALSQVNSDDLPAAAGYAIRRTTLWVADHQGQPLPPNLLGELQIGGDGLALGYLGAPAQTAASFRPDPLAGRPGARVYRSGDRAYLLSNGKISIHGRLDSQEKLNGFRVEMEEIESKLRELPGVRQAAAAIRHDPQGHAQLVAYLVPDSSGSWRIGDETDPATLQRARTQLSEALPNYMLPARFLTLDQLPLTSNRKLDRRALPEPSSPEPGHTRSAPSNVLEKAVCAIWEDVFERAGIAADDDFFDMGGHSLLATRIQVRVNKIFRQTLPLRATFHAQTPRALAALLIEHEPTPGLSEKIATVYMKLRSMSNTERDALRESSTPPRTMETKA